MTKNITLILIIIFTLTVRFVSGFTPCETNVVKKGCFKDHAAANKNNERPLNILLMDYRNKIDWKEGWNGFVHNFVCDCAKQAKSKGYRYFGLQFYGECWSGDPSVDLFKDKPASADQCWGYKPNYAQCDDKAETECIGREEHNYIYEIVQQETIIPICEQGVPCKNGGECVPRGGNSYTCQCLPDYEGENCENKVDHCANSPCLNEGQCVKKDNIYQCECKPGFEGKTCEKLTDINDCAETTCLNEGKCIDEVNSYRCECKPGYEGKNCQTNIDECAGKPCLNGGKCVDEVNSYRCESCKPGFKGKNCEIDIDECELKPCMNGGKCIDNVNSYQCECKLGFEGKHCSTNVDDCAEKPCVNGGKCVDDVNSYRCECKPGYGGKNCQTDIDDCAESPCLNGGQCVDEVNSYRCICKSGCEGDRCEVALRPSSCSNVNWWASFDKQGWSKCRNQNVFITGFWRNAQSTGWFSTDKIYKLEEAKCCPPISVYIGQESNCKNANWWSSLDKKGSWGTCPSGYFLNGLYRTSGNNLHNIEEGRCCKPKQHPKSYEDCYDENIGKRFDAKGWSTCSKVGYFVTGIHRDNSGGDSLHNLDKFKCCKMWTGIGQCAKRPCLNDGKCVNEVNSYRCTCKPGYDGENCQIVLRPSSCSNANWWATFDNQGWSTCGNDKVFITGFWRSGQSWLSSDGIYRLEEAQCCPPISLYTGIESDCKNANWWSSFDKPGTWCTCPSGYFLNGLYRTSGKKLHHIEEGRCCKPKKHPERYADCYHENIGTRFDAKGWSTCSKVGYFVTGIHRDNHNDWLHNLDKFKCCKMWTGT